jgi:hypothetical protein
LVKTKDRLTVGNLKTAELSANPAASQISSPSSTMIYAVGVSMGRDQVVQAHHNHPACHQ